MEYEYYPRKENVIRARVRASHNGDLIYQFKDGVNPILTTLIWIIAGVAIIGIPAMFVVLATFGG